MMCYWLEHRNSLNEHVSDIPQSRLSAKSQLTPDDLSADIDIIDGHLACERTHLPNRVALKAALAHR
jgi:hypothetical protein